MSVTGTRRCPAGRSAAGRARGVTDPVSAFAGTRGPQGRVGCLLALIAAMVVGATGLTPLQNAAAAAPSDDGPRTGRIRFESHDTVYRSMAQRMEPVARITLPARLRLPESASGQRLPAMILVHGSSGPQWDHKARYEALLNDAGIATLTIDSFGPRGIRRSVGNQAVLSVANQTYDAFRALQWLRDHPLIDPQRIGVIGWSRGGTVAVAAWRQRNVAEYRRHSGVGNGFGFAAHVAFYPSCGGREAEIAMTAAPLLMLIGEDDDWTGVRVCRDWAEAVRAAGHDVELVTWAGAAHGFDYPGDFRRRYPNGMSLRDCAWVRRDDGFVDLATGRFRSWGPDYRNWYAWRRSCAARGVTVATDREARAGARARVRDFVVDTFRVGVAD